MINLPEPYLEEIRRILHEHVPECEVRVIGSRVQGTAQKYSDLDLVLFSPEKISPKRLETLKDAFAESDLPIQVDLLDWNDVSDSFRSLIEKHDEVLKFAE